MVNFRNDGAKSIVSGSVRTGGVTLPDILGDWNLLRYVNQLLSEIQSRRNAFRQVAQTPLSAIDHWVMWNKNIIAEAYDLGYAFNARYGRTDLYNEVMKWYGGDSWGVCFRKDKTTVTLNKDWRGLFQLNRKALAINSNKYITKVNKVTEVDGISVYRADLTIFPNSYCYSAQATTEKRYLSVTPVKFSIGKTVSGSMRGVKVRQRNEIVKILS